MKVLILMGSPRIHGNTAELCIPFMEVLHENDAEIKYVEFADMIIEKGRGSRNVRSKNF